METPLIFDDSGALFFFKTKKDAERYLEPIDIQNNEYIAYDSRGRLLTLSTYVDNEPRWLGFFNRKRTKILIEDAEDQPSHAKELYQKLKHFYMKLSPSVTLNPDLSLEDLLSMTIEKSGYCE